MLSWDAFGVIKGYSKNSIITGCRRQFFLFPIINLDIGGGKVHRWTSKFKIANRSMKILSKQYWNFLWGNTTTSEITRKKDKEKGRKIFLWFLVLFRDWCRLQIRLQCRNTVWCFHNLSLLRVQSEALNSCHSYLYRDWWADRFDWNHWFGWCWK